MSGADPIALRNTRAKDATSLYRNLDYHDVWRAYVNWGVRSREESWTFSKACEVFAAANFELGHFTREMFVTLHPGFRLAGMLESVRAGKCGWRAPEVIRSHGVELESRREVTAAEKECL